jgi:rare lipoprotein A
MRRAPVAVVALMLVSFAGTALADRPARHADEALAVWRMGTVQTSWYGGTFFHGRKMSNGKRFDRYGRSAAHRTLALGTVVRLTHPTNGRSEIVTIDDRGPFIRGRVFDVSEGTAMRLGFREQGLAMLQAEVLR